MRLVFSKDFQQMLRERANEENTTISKYIMCKMTEVWDREGYSFDKENMLKISKDPKCSKLYKKNGIVCSKSYDYEFCKTVMDMYNDGATAFSIAKKLGKHQKTIWRIVDRNLNKGDE